MQKGRTKDYSKVGYAAPVVGFNIAGFVLVAFLFTQLIG